MNPVMPNAGGCRSSGGGRTRADVGAGLRGHGDSSIGTTGVRDSDGLISCVIIVSKFTTLRPGLRAILSCNMDALCEQFVGSLVGSHVAHRQLLSASGQHPIRGKHLDDYETDTTE